MKKTKPNRKVIVFVSLIGTLTLTSALLLTLAPAPLSPEASTSLFAVDAPASMDAVFDTQNPAVMGRWRYIFVHHSRTRGGNADTLAKDDALGDHFVIGNGNGCVDGEIQFTQDWNLQNSITNPPAGVSRMDPGCISICLIGDFDRDQPTTAQQRQLAQLVSALQSRLRIPSVRVLTLDQPGSTAGVGGAFPVAAFRNQILP